MEAFSDLTGCPTSTYDMTNQFVQKTIENGDLWRLLQYFIKERFLLNASTYGEEDEIEGSFIVEYDKHQDP